MKRNTGGSICSSWSTQFGVYKRGHSPRAAELSADNREGSLLIRVFGKSVSSARKVEINTSRLACRRAKIVRGTDLWSVHRPLSNRPGSGGTRGLSSLSLCSEFFLNFSPACKRDHHNFYCHLVRIVLPAPACRRWVAVGASP